MGEMENLARVWFIAFASLLFVYAIVARLPKNAPRLMASLPIAYLFLKLPWLLSTVFLRTASAFFLVWLCSFRLTLFCFDSGPLAENRNSLIRFLVFGALPVKVKQRAGGSRNKLQQQHDLNGKIFQLILYRQQYDEKPNPKERMVTMVLLVTDQDLTTRKARSAVLLDMWT